jgi:chemotaxis protein methyltransferase WspC
MNKYFTKDKDLHQISDQVKKTVRFKQGNLFHENILSNPSYYDAIFCRNLLIYFNSNEKKKAFEKLNASLKDKGILLIGHSESSIIPTEFYAQCGIPRSFGFIKSTLPLKRKKKSVVTKKTAAIQKNPSTKKVAAKTLKPRPEQPEIIQKRPSRKPTLKDARTLADRSQFEEALVMLDTFSSNLQTADFFTLKGTIYSALTQADQAEAAYRKALFLSPKHQEALIHLAFLLDKKGEHKQSQLLRKRVEKSRIKVK